MIDAALTGGLIVAVIAWFGLRRGEHPVIMFEMEHRFEREYDLAKVTGRHDNLRQSMPA